MTISRRNLLEATAAAAAARVLPACRPTTSGAEPGDLVVGPGAWCWFQSPRAAVDGHDVLWLGSTQGSGAPSPGSVDVTAVDLRAWRVRSRRSLGRDRVDDHTSPSVLPVAGTVQVGWAAHRRLDWVELGPLDGLRRRIVRPQALVDPGRGTAYVSAHVVAGQRWALYRGESFSWNLLTSADGTSWVGHGLVVAPARTGQRPYLLAASDGRRLHLLVTDANPTEWPGCSAWAGVVDADLRIRTTGGRQVGRVGERAPRPDQLSPVASGRPGPVDEAGDTDVWLVDLRVHDGAPVALLSVREPWPAAEAAVGGWRHRILHARPDGDGRWHATHVAWAGSELYANQPDYCGLASLDPADPGAVVVSTNVHPATGAALRSAIDGLVHHELWSGHRRGQGWRWTPITADSVEDNLRPVLVRSGRGRIVAWMRGTYRSWTSFDTSLVVRFA